MSSEKTAPSIPQEIRERAILVGDTALSFAAFPIMMLTEKIPGLERATGVGLALSILAWPIAVPAALVFGRAYERYERRFKVYELRREREERPLHPRTSFSLD